MHKRATRLSILTLISIHFMWWWWCQWWLFYLKTSGFLNKNKFNKSGFKWQYIVQLYILFECFYIIRWANLIFIFWPYIPISLFECTLHPVIANNDHSRRNFFQSLKPFRRLLLTVTARERAVAQQWNSIKKERKKSKLEHCFHQMWWPYTATY